MNKLNSLYIIIIANLTYNLINNLNSSHQILSHAIMPPTGYNLYGYHGDDFISTGHAQGDML